MANIYSHILFYLIDLINLIFKQKETKIDYENIQNILIINPQGIGDYFVSTPLINSLRGKFSEAKIVLLVSERSFEAAKNDPHVNKIFIYDEKYYSLIKELRNEKFDLIIDLQITLLSFKRTLLSYLANAPYRLAYKRKKFRSFLPTHEVSWLGKHMVDNYLEIARYLNCNIHDKNIIVNTNYPISNSIINIFNKSRINLGLHASTTNKLHKWSVKNWLKLIKTLNEKYKDIKIILTGENDEQMQEITKYVKSDDVINLIGKLSITELIKVIEKLDILITIDTSTVHIAAGLNTPTIAIYGPTILDFWGPWNKKKQIAIQEQLVCKGKCREYNLDSLIISKEKCTEETNICLSKQISVELVLEKFDYFLKKVNK